MTVGKRIWFSFVIGWSIKLIPLSIHALFENQITAVFAGIANLDVLIAIKFFGGSQITLGHIVIYTLAFLIGLIVYPIIIFVILTIWQKIKANKI